MYYDFSWSTAELMPAENLILNCLISIWIDRSQICIHGTDLCLSYSLILRQHHHVRHPRSHQSQRFRYQRCCRSARSHFYATVRTLTRTANPSAYWLFNYRHRGQDAVGIATVRYHHPLIGSELTESLYSVRRGARFIKLRATDLSQKYSMVMDLE